MIDAALLLPSLAEQRPIFHSEADFQHAFAWLLHEAYPEVDVRLEYPAETGAHVDIWLRTAEGNVAIDLKYRTRSFTTETQEERFLLGNQGAVPIGRFSFIKDIVRVEQLVDEGEADAGLAVLLTNDPSY